MNDPNVLLVEKRAQIAGLEAALEMEKAELRGMEAMAALLTKPVPMSRTHVPRAINIRTDDLGGRGRQPGSISKRWRAVLWRLDGLGGDFTPIDIVDAVRDLEGRSTRPTDARRQMEGYVELGFIRLDNGKYNVTDEFRAKFADSGDQARLNEMLGDFYSPKENEPPSENAGGSDASLGSATNATEAPINPNS